MKKKQLSIIENLIWNSAGSFTYLICQWLLTWIIVVHSKDLGNAGNLALAISITNIFFNLACFNIRPYLVSDLKQCYRSEQYSAFRLFTCLASLILCLIYTCMFGYTMDQIICVMLYMVFKLGEAWVDLLHGFEQRKMRMDIGGISLFIRGILSVLSFMAGVRFSGSVNTGIIFMTVCTWSFIFLYDMPQARKFEKIAPVFTKETIKRMLIEFLPLTIGGVLSSLGPSLPRQFLEAEQGSKVLGIYSTVATPAVFVQVAATYVFNPVLTEFASLYQRGEKRRFLKLLFKISFFLLAVSGASLVGGAVLGQWGLTFLYGKRIGTHADLFLPVIIFTCLNAMSWFLWSILIIFRELKALLVINVIGVIVCILIMFPLISRYGMQGVNDTLILYTCVLLVLMAVLVGRDIKCKFDR